MHKILARIVSSILGFVCLCLPLMSFAEMNNASQCASIIDRNFQLEKSLLCEVGGETGKVRKTCFNLGVDKVFNAKAVQARSEDYFISKHWTHSPDTFRCYRVIPFSGCEDVRVSFDADRLTVYRYKKPDLLSDYTVHEELKVDLKTGVGTLEEHVSTSEKKTSQKSKVVCR